MVLLTIEECPSGELRVRALAETTLSSFLSFNQNQWTHVIATCEATSSSSSGDSYLGGEGSYGSDGFVARVGKGGELIYCVFLTRSNPFVGLALNDDETVLIATSNLGAKWSFNVARPWAITAVP
jgi:hypothetical protein